jgi:hypothetical protein
MIELHDVFPGYGVAGQTAADQHCYDLGVFQPALPGTPGFRTAGSADHADLNTTTEIRFCGPKSSIALQKDGIVSGQTS